jgi:hypothetical protein
MRSDVIGMTVITGGARREHGLTPSLHEKLAQFTRCSTEDIGVGKMRVRKAEVVLALRIYIVYLQGGNAFLAPPSARNEPAIAPRRLLTVRKDDDIKRLICGDK